MERVLHCHPSCQGPVLGEWSCMVVRCSSAPCQPLALIRQWARFPASERCRASILGLPLQALLTRSLWEHQVVAALRHNAHLQPPPGLGIRW